MGEATERFGGRDEGIDVCFEVRDGWGQSG